MVKVITTYVSPPIPRRDHDFSAHIDGQEDGVTGFGRNSALALVDLSNHLFEDNRHQEYLAVLAALIDLDISDAETDGRNSSFVLGLKSAKRTIEGAAP